MKNLKTKRAYTRRSVSVDLVKPAEFTSQDNPFVIEEGVTLIGNRGGSAIVALQLLEQIKKLPVDKNVSVVIPKSIASKPNEATNLVLRVRRFISEDKNISKNFAITMRVFKDANGQLVNSRVWRIS